MRCIICKEIYVTHKEILSDNEFTYILLLNGIRDLVCDVMYMDQEITMPSKTAYMCRESEKS